MYMYNIRANYSDTSMKLIKVTNPKSIQWACESTSYKVPIKIKSCHCLNNSAIGRDIEVTYKIIKLISQSITPALNSFQPLVNNESSWYEQRVVLSLIYVF